MRGVAGLANHKSFENCNAVFRPFKANGKFYMRLVAVKPIRNGDEIFADYGDDYIFDDFLPETPYLHIGISKEFI